MAQVYYGQDVKLERPVAIKVIDARYRDKPTYAERFVREAKAAAAWRHEHIVQIYYADDEDGLYYVAMEYIDGHNLRKHIKERDLNIGQMIDLTIRLCHGLDFLHQQGIVHRDVKPENFLFSRDMKAVKIVDFGLSKSTASWKTRWMKEGGGTRRYMSPEQLSKKKLDARSDIFSLGITLYELFAGKHPCDGQDSRHGPVL